MIAISPITPLNAFAFKAVRLRALQDSPHAFGSTYEKESQFAEPEWLARAERMNGERGIGFLAIDGETGCGIVGCFLDQHDPTRAQLVSMWTAPTHRRQGVGRLLLAALLAPVTKLSSKSYQFSPTKVEAQCIRQKYIPCDIHSEPIRF